MSAMEVTVETKPLKSEPYDQPWIANASFNGGQYQLSSAFVEFADQVLKSVWGSFDPKTEKILLQLEDHMAYLKLGEAKRKVFTASITKRPRTRKDAIEIIFDMVKGEGLSKATLFLAVYIYDRVGCYYMIEKFVSGLTAAAAVLIAGKLEEEKTKIPKVEKLLSYIPEVQLKRLSQENVVYPDIPLRTLEREFLRYLDWNIMVPTAISFYQVFALFIVQPRELPSFRYQWKSLSSTSAQEDVQQTLPSSEALHLLGLKVLETLLREEPDENFPPSLVAAAVILYARVSYGYYHWTECLQFVTDYSREEVLACAGMYVCPTLDKVHKGNRHLYYHCELRCFPA